MKKMVIGLMLTFLLAGCNGLGSERAAVEKALIKIEEADVLQAKINSNFKDIENASSQTDKSTIKKCTQEICLDSSKEKATVNEAIKSIEEARKSTGDYQLKTFYDMKIKALLLKIDLAENSFMYANKIEDGYSDSEKTKEHLHYYNKINNKLSESYEQLDKEAEEFLGLKSG